jgi:calcium/proton exchanger cax
MNLAVGIALFVAPGLVLAGCFVAPRPFGLSFSRSEIGSLLMAVLIGIAIAGDGRSKW